MRGSLAAALCALVSLASYHRHVHAQPVCGFAGFDFTSLMSADLKGVNPATNLTYLLRVCGSMDSAACDDAAGFGSGLSVCQLDAGGSNAIDVGNWDPVQSPTTWQMVNPWVGYGAGVMYTLVSNVSSSPACMVSGTPYPYTTDVSFTCGQELSVSVTTPYETLCTFEIGVQTPLACAKPLPPAGACSFAGFDLSSLMWKDVAGSDGTNVYDYHLSVCGYLQDQPACTAVMSTSSACQIETGGAKAAFDIGNWVSPPDWTFIDGVQASGGIQYTLLGDTQCWASGNPTNYVANVQFVCGAAEPMTVSNPLNGCVQNWTISTPLVCPADREEVEISID